MPETLAHRWAIPSLHRDLGRKAHSRFSLRATRWTQLRVLPEGGRASPPGGVLAQRTTWRPAGLPDSHTVREPQHHVVGCRGFTATGTQAARGDRVHECPPKDRAGRQGPTGTQPCGVCVGRGTGSSPRRCEGFSGDRCPGSPLFITATRR